MYVMFVIMLNISNKVLYKLNWIIVKFFLEDGKVKIKN